MNQDTEALKALVALAQKFRSGRWMTVSDWNRYAVMEENHPHERFVCTFNQKPVSMQGRKLDPVDYCGADRTTAEFIAAAKNAIPALERMLASQMGKPAAGMDADKIAAEICEKYMYGSSPELRAEIAAIIRRHMVK